MTDEVIVRVIEEETINVSITEETPIIIELDDGVPGWLSDIFVPDEDGLRITKMYIKNGKLKVKYEDGE